MSIFTAAWAPGARRGRLSPISSATPSLLTPQPGTTNAPHQAERLACITDRSLAKPATSSRSLTFAAQADVSTAPNSYTHLHRAENSYRGDRSYQRTLGPEVYKPGQWAAPSDGRLLNTSGNAIDGWGEEEDGEIGDIQREANEAARERELAESE
jgi:hypothetical protein